jgi:hypothetical protein
MIVILPKTGMLRSMSVPAWLIVFFCISPVVSAAQQPTPEQTVLGIAVPAVGETQELVLKDGSRAFGRVERVDGTRLVFITTAGATIEVETSQVASVGLVEGRIVDGEFRRADSNPTRLFFAPTGRSLKRGEAYLGVYQILLPFVQFGITDRISIGGGTPLLFGLGSEHPFWVTPKVQVIDRPSTKVSLGVLHFLNVGDGNLGIAYGVVTQGHTDSALTFGLGYAYERSYGENSGAAVAMAGGEHRFRRSMKIVTENYFFSEGGLVSVGVRWMGEHLSADLGLAAPLGVDEIFVFPIVNFVWSFSRR